LRSHDLHATRLYRRRVRHDWPPHVNRGSGLLSNQSGGKGPAFVGGLCAGLKYCTAASAAFMLTNPFDELFAAADYAIKEAVKRLRRAAPTPQSDAVLELAIN
jgi:hypothetical protein